MYVIDDMEPSSKEPQISACLKHEMGVFKPSKLFGRGGKRKRIFFRSGRLLYTSGRCDEIKATPWRRCFLTGQWSRPTNDSPMRPTAMSRLDSTHRDLSIGMGAREGPGASRSRSMVCRRGDEMKPKSLRLSQKSNRCDPINPAISQNGCLVRPKMGHSSSHLVRIVVT